MGLFGFGKKKEAAKPKEEAPVVDREVDEAIAAFEQSLEANRVMGKASATLVKLYNKKRAAAAEAKDDEAIKFYLAKVNEMLAISKDQLRGK